VPSPENRLDEEAIAVPELVNYSLRMVLSSTESALANAVARAVLQAAGSAQSYAAHGSSPVRPPDEAK
jgi:hypothetical protein